MPIEILLEARPFGFLPATDNDRDILRTFATGSLVKASIVRGKSPQAMKFYWKMIELVGEGVGIGKRPLSNELLIRTGYVEKMVLLNNEVHVIPRSIADMKHSEFTEYMNAAIEMVCREYIADMTRGELLKQVESMLNVTFAEAFAGSQKRKVH